MTPEREWLLLQWLDSAFPSGGYAHSFGLEAWDQLAPKEESAVIAIEVSCVSQLQLALPPVREAHAAGLHDASALAHVQASADAHLWGTVARRASLRQGRALIEATVRSMPSDHPAQAAARWTRTGETSMHHAVAFGAIASSLCEDVERVASVFAFTLGRAAVSAAVRLNLLGPFAGQRLLAGLAPRLQQVCDAKLPAASAAPWLDLLMEQHDALHTRLFSS